MNLVGVPSGEARKEWPACAAFLDPAIARSNGTLSAESILTACGDQAAQLWKFEDGTKLEGAMVTEVRNLQSGVKTIHILAFGGQNISALREVESDLCGWGLHLGARKITADCRFGFTRRLDGWEPKTVMMEREIHG